MCLTLNLPGAAHRAQAEVPGGEVPHPGGDRGGQVS